MTADEYEQLPPEEKERFAKCSDVPKSLIGEAWTKCFSTTPTISTARTFSIPARKS